MSTVSCPATGAEGSKKNIWQLLPSCVVSIDQQLHVRCENPRLIGDSGWFGNALQGARAGAVLRKSVC